MTWPQLEGLRRNWLLKKWGGGGGGKGGVLCSFAGSFHLLLGAYDSITLFVHSISISLFYTERVPFGYGKHS